MNFAITKVAGSELAQIEYSYVVLNDKGYSYVI